MSTSPARSRVRPAHFLETTDDDDLRGYTLVRYYRRDQQTFRVTVRRDHRQFQSHAHAEVFTPSQTWTLVVSNAPSHWYETTSIDANRGIGHAREPGYRTLRRLADDLARDAILIVPA